LRVEGGKGEGGETGGILSQGGGRGGRVGASGAGKNLFIVTARALNGIYGGGKGEERQKRVRLEESRKRARLYAHFLLTRSGGEKRGTETQERVR